MTAPSSGREVASSAAGPAPFWVRWPNLLQPRLGAEVEWATDEFFAPRHRLILPEPPVFRPGVYDEHGKWMDGWETRRRRDGGHDYCVLRLGLRAIVHGVEIDTRFFDGNQPVSARIEAWDGAGLPGAAPTGAGSPLDDARWWPLVPETPLGPDRLHRVAVEAPRPATHLRFHIVPDGGVARLRAYGEAVCDWAHRDPGTVWDLVAIESGGQALAASDQHFGAMHHLVFPGRGRDMGDGWETRRRRGPGYDWVLLRLGHPGAIERVEVDTAHFKGNYPDRCSLQAVLSERDEPDPSALALRSESWPLLVPEQKLEPDQVHVWTLESARAVAALGPVSHVRLNIFPDGGVSRLRLLGRIASGGGQP